MRDGAAFDGGHCFVMPKLFDQGIDEAMPSKVDYFSGFLIGTE